MDAGFGQGDFTSRSRFSSTQGRSAIEGLPAIESLDVRRNLSEAADPPSSIEAGVRPPTIYNAEPSQSLTPLAQLSQDASGDCHRNQDQPKSELHVRQCQVKVLYTLISGSLVPRPDIIPHPTDRANGRTIVTGIAL
jgi:hypothetical protein